MTALRVPNRWNSAPVRKVRSTSWYDASASTTRTTSRTNVSWNPVRCVLSVLTNTRTGQCHRYNEYDRRPIATNAPDDSSRARPVRRAWVTLHTTTHTTAENTKKPPRYSHVAS